MRIAVTAPQPPALVKAWRNRGYLADGRLGWLLEDAASRWPTREALVEPAGRHTFAELRRRSEAIAIALIDGGVEPGDTVVWTLPNGVDAVAVAAAIWRIGAVNAPVVTIYREHEWTYVLDTLRPAAVVAPAAYRGRSHAEELDGVLAAIGHTPRVRFVSGGTRHGWTPLDGLDAPNDGLPPEVEPSPADEPCLVLWTSGTTAAPKGVVQTPAALLHEMRMMSSQWALTWMDAMYMASPVTHITGLLQGLLVPTAVGARAVLADRWDPEAAVDAIEAEGCTFMSGATPFLQGLVEVYEKRGLASKLREYSCGGAAVPPSLVERAEGVGVKVHRAWGLSELPTATMAGRLDPLERRANYDGRIAPACEVEAVDEERRPLPPGNEGELRTRGPERMAGYVDAALNADALDAEGWLYTGDLGIVDDEGWVKVTGRVKEVINRGGEKLSARDIEDVLAAHPAVAEVAVVGIPGGRLGERVCALVVPAAGSEVDPTALTAYLEARRVAKQKIPEEFRAATELPRTAAGKVQKFRIVQDWGTA